MADPKKLFPVLTLISGGTILALMMLISVSSPTDSIIHNGMSITMVMAVLQGLLAFVARRITVGLSSFVKIGISFFAIISPAVFLAALIYDVVIFIVYMDKA